MEAYDIDSPNEFDLQNMDVAWDMYELYWDMDPDMREEFWPDFADMMPWFEYDEDTGEWKYVS